MTATRVADDSSYVLQCKELGVNPLQAVQTALISGGSVFKITADHALGSADVEAFTSAIAMSEVQELFLENLTMPEDAWLSVSSAAHACSIKLLSVATCSLGEVDSSLLAAALGRLTSLKHLSLTNTGLSPEFISALVKTPLFDNESTLSSLELGYNSVGDTGAVAIAHAMVTKDLNIRCLDLSYNDLGDNGAQALGYAIAEDRKARGKKEVKLEILELEGNKISDMGGVALGAALFKAKTLGRLNLGANDLGHTALHALSDSLMSGASGLKELMLDDNRMHAADLVYLIQAVSQHRGLWLLDIRGTHLQASSTNALCTLLRGQCSLKSLKADVSTSVQASEIARAMRKNFEIVELEIGGNVDDESLANIERALARNISGLEGKPEPVASAATEKPKIPVKRLSEPPYIAFTKPVPLQGFPSPSARTVQYAQEPPSAPAMRPIKYSQAPAAPANRNTQSPSRQRSAAHAITQRGKKKAAPSPGAQNAPLKPALNVTHKVVLKPTTPNIGRRGSYIGKYKSEQDAHIFSSVVGGGAQAMAGEIFRKCDRNNSGLLERDEFKAAMKMAGMLNGIKTSEMTSHINTLFRKSDTFSKGGLSVGQWGDVFALDMANQGVKNHRKKIEIPSSFQVAVPKGYLQNHVLKDIFDSFSGFGYGHGSTRHGRQDKMNAFQFCKLCRDAGFMEPHGNLSPTAIDVIFTKANKYNMNNRNLSYKAFLEALALVAFELDVEFDDVVAMLGVTPVPKEVEAMAMAPSQDIQEIQDYGSPDTSRQSHYAVPQDRNERPFSAPPQGLAKPVSLQKNPVYSSTSSETDFRHDPKQDMQLEPPTAGGMSPDAVGLADLLSQRLKLELDSFMLGMESRLSGIESRLAAVESKGR